MNDPKQLNDMTIDRLEQILDAYGAAPQAWPAGERAAALALMERSESARQLCEQAAQLDSLLDTAADIEASSELRARVLGALPSKPMSWAARLDRVATWVWPFGPTWRPAAALVAAAALGIGVGTWIPNDPTADVDTASTPDVSELVFAGYAYSGDEP